MALMTGALRERTSKKRADKAKRIRAIARERIGSVKPSRPIESKARRRGQPKHKRPPSEED